MAIADNYVPLRQIGNNVTVAFSAAWNMIAAAYALVYLEDAVTGVQTAVPPGPGAGQYTLVFSASGFTVTYGTAPTAAQYAVIARSVAQDQTDPYRTSKGFQGQVLESSLDKLTAMVQDISDVASRSIAFKLGSTSTATMPEPLATALIGWNVAGTNLQNWLTASTALTPVTVYMATVLTSPNAAAAQSALGISAFAQTILDDANAAAVRATIGAIAATDLPSFMPGGRLSLQSSTPVMNGDVTAASTVYYTAFASGNIPVYNGTSWTNLVFAPQLTLTLNATDNPTGNNYDVFIYNNASVAAIGTGPAWSSSTARGTGAGTTEIAKTGGIWTNTNAITLRSNGVNLGSIAVNRATYIGTIRTTANGQTGMNFFPAGGAGGTNNVLYVWNAYNRVRYTSRVVDTTASWTYTSSTIRPANNSASNRINFVDGLAESFLQATYTNNIAGTAATAYPYLGMGIDSTTVNSVYCSPAGCSLTNNAQFTALLSATPQGGAHFLQAIESNVSNTSTANFGNLTGAGQQSVALTLTMDM